MDSPESPLVHPLVRPRRHRMGVALTLFAYAVVGATLLLPCVGHDDRWDLADLVRADLREGARAHATLRFAEAETHLRRALDIAQRAQSGANYDPEIHAAVLTRLGGVLQDEGRYAQAERCYRRAAALANRVQSRYSDAAVEPLARLRALYDRTGDADRAEACRAEIDSIVVRVEPIHLRAIELQRGVMEARGERLAENLAALAALYHARGDAAAAESLYAETFAIRSRNAAADRPDALDDLVNWSAAGFDAQDDEAAAAMLREVVATAGARYGADDPRLRSFYYDLGVLAQRGGRPGEAERYFRRALAIEEAALGPDHPCSARTLESLAWVERDQRKYASARAHQVRVIEIRRRVFGEESPQVGAALLALAVTEAASGDRVSARAVCGEALDELMRAVGPLDRLTLEGETLHRLLSRYWPSGSFRSTRTPAIGAG